MATFSKQNGKQLILADVLNAEGIRRLPSLLDQVARFQYDIKNNKPLDENGFMVKKIEVTKNIYVTGACVGFVYLPYEIKSFAEGEINLVVPFTILKPYLLPGYQ